MATDETRVKVILEVAEAMRELDRLSEKGEKWSDNVVSKTSSGVSRGLAAVGLGGGIGMGMAAIRGATESGFSDVISEAFGGIGARLEEAVFGDQSLDSRAKRTTREEAIQAFGAIAGAQGKIPPGVKNWFDSVKSLHMNEEKGRRMFETNDDFRGAGVMELIDKLVAGFRQLFSEAVDALANKLNPFK